MKKFMYLALVLGLGIAFASQPASACGLEKHDGTATADTTTESK